MLPGIKPDDKRTFALRADKSTNKVVIVSKDAGKKRWSKYHVSEENRQTIDEMFKDEFLEIFGMEISTPEDWLRQYYEITAAITILIVLQHHTLNKDQRIRNPVQPDHS